MFLACTAHLTQAIPVARHKIQALLCSRGGSQEARGAWRVLQSCWDWEPQHSSQGWAVLPISFVTVSIPGSVLLLGTQDVGCQELYLGCITFCKKQKFKKNFKIKTRKEVGTSKENLTSTSSSPPQYYKPTALKCHIPWIGQLHLLSAM